MKKKIWASLFALIFMFTLFPSSTLAKEDKEVKLWIHGEYVETDAKPFLEDGRTLVPVRVISETLGYEIAWDEELFTVTVSDFNEERNSFNKLFVLTIDNKIVVEYDTDKINKLFLQNPTEEMLDKVMKDSAKKFEIDVPPRLVEKRTFVPVRVVAELMGEEVTWDEDTWTVVIGEGYKNN